MRNLVLSLAAVALTACASAPAAPSNLLEGAWGAAEIDPILDKTRRLRLTMEPGVLTPAEEAAVVELLVAGQVLHRLYLEQRHPQGVGDTIDDIGDHPVVQVSWRDALAFCQFHGLRLPSEEEWEYAARGDDNRRYTWGDDAPSTGGHANFGTHACCGPDADDGYLRTAPVGHYAEGISPFGAFDVAGNVWEWTATPDGDTGRYIIKGGGWGNNLYCLRASYRHRNPPDIGLDMVGIRCAADL